VEKCSKHIAREEKCKNITSSEEHSAKIQSVEQEEKCKNTVNKAGEEKCKNIVGREKLNAKLQSVTRRKVQKYNE
jgi:hypothetical protein